MMNISKIALRWVLAFGLIVSVTALGCKKEDQDVVDDERIQQYLSDNNLPATAHNSGIYYYIQDTGFGGNPDINSSVTVYYRGTLLDGSEFDAVQRPSSPISFPLASVIAGWQIGIPLFQKGGKGVLYIPSALGYGSRATGSIPKNSVLIFDVELVDFQ